MRKNVMAATALTVAAGAAQAGGLDRSNTPTDIIFEDGTYAELSFGFVSPDVTGNDFFGVPYANVADQFALLGAGVKVDLKGPLSLAVILDQPYGSDVTYGGAPAATLLGGTSAIADSEGLTALLKYDVGERFSVYGGPRMVNAGGTIVLSGQAYNGGPGANLVGYTVNFDDDHGFGYVAGAAYEIPDIAFRAALTYHSPIDINFDTTETVPVTAGGPGVPVPTGTTDSELPQSVELSVQSGIAPRTLAFGSIRWSEWNAFTLTPLLLGANLADFDNWTRYELGVGRRFTDRFSGSLSVAYETSDGDSLVSPLAPTNGQTAVSIGGKYQVTEMVSLSGGVQYTWLGNALPEVGTPDTPVGFFSDNTALSAGVKIGINLN